MNRQEILADIEALKERLNKLEKMYDSLTTPNKRWRAKKDDDYYFISAEGSAYLDRENEVIVDGLHYDIGNYFKTEEEAKFEVERLKVIAELKEWATPISEFNWNDNTQKKYVIILENNYLRVDFFCSLQTCDLYFESREIAENAIEAVGKERIIKYYFRRGENNADSN